MMPEAERSSVERVRGWFQASLEVQARLAESQAPAVARIADLISQTFRAGGKLLLFGNGGSAADAQHVAAEFVSRFKLERRALPAIALSTDTSILTGIGNDYHFDQVFARQVRALARPDDLAVGISTSGNSPDVLNAVVAARECGARTVGFTGARGGRLRDLVDLCFHAPSDDTALIQQAHLAAWHAICLVVEQDLSS
ncbi:MAG TPA: D-sedoheptulose 7-phosphate isomerase [Roseiflexaceae bacterium]|nr:D-sedoheptulose 7-phosphate isomerase [Roseiflexaceae bacterium]